MHIETPHSCNLHEKTWSRVLLYAGKVSYFRDILRVKCRTCVYHVLWTWQIFGTCPMNMTHVIHVLDMFPLVSCLTPRIHDTGWVGHVWLLIMPSSLYMTCNYLVHMSSILSMTCIDLTHISWSVSPMYSKFL